MADQDKSLRRVEDLLKDLIIVQLAIAGVGQKEIRQVVGGDIVRVNKIVKRVRKFVKPEKGNRK